MSEVMTRESDPLGWWQEHAMWLEEQHMSLIRELRETIKPPATPYPDADPGRMPFLYEFQRGWAAANEQVAWIIDKYDREES